MAFDHVEAEFAQGSRDIGGVIRRIGKLGGVAILAVADHERYAAADRDRDGGGRNGDWLGVAATLPFAAASFCSMRAMPFAASRPPVCLLSGSRLSAAR